MDDIGDPTGQSLAELIVRDLREQILAGRLSPGLRLSQASIATQYGVSRLPVRVALRELGGEGLIVIQSGKGARVAGLNAEDLHEVYMLRERLEPLAMGLAVQHVSEVHLIAAANILQLMNERQAPDDEWLILDRQFHMMWYELVAMPRMIRIVEQLWDVAQRYRSSFSMMPGAVEKSHLDHLIMLDAIGRRSAPDASALLEVHVRRTRLALEGTLPTGTASRPGGRGKSGRAADGSLARADARLAPGP